MRLQGKSIIVTGSGGGIGEGIARRLADEGASVIVNDINPAMGEKVAADIRAQGGQAAFFAADVTSSADVKALVDFAVQRNGKLDVMVAGFSAGMFNALDSGLKFEIVGSMGISTGDPAKSPTALEVSKASGITDIKGLKGKKIAAAGGPGATGGYLLAQVLESADLTLKDVEVVTSSDQRLICQRASAVSTRPSATIQRGSTREISRPTMNIAIRRCLATRISRAVASRTCATDPAALDSAGSCSVWTESTTQTAGRSASSVASTTDTSVSAMIGTFSAPGLIRSARRRTWAADSSPVT